MTHTDEELLALADRLDGIEIFSVREHLSGLGTRPIEAANNAVCEAAAALRAIVAERQKPHTYVGGEASVAVCPICDIAGCHHIRDAGKAALDVSETPAVDTQRDLVTADERQSIRDKALEDAAMCCEAEADKCDDAMKWSGHPKYIANCKAAAYAMRDRATAIRAMKGKPQMTPAERIAAHWAQTKLMVE